MLFEPKTRTNMKFKNHTQPTYDFYDSSAKPQFVKVRERLNRWFVNYPTEAQQELKSRFINSSFEDAYFELFIHELFRKQGFKLEAHPIVPNTSKTPDFLAYNDEVRFYIEAKVVSGRSDDEEAKIRKQNYFYDQIAKIRSANFYLAIDDLEIKTADQPRANKIIKELSSFLESHKPDAVDEILKDQRLELLPSIQVEDEKIFLKVSLLPKSANHRISSQSPIGVYPGKSGFPNTPMHLKRAILNKAGRYGVPDLPYLICINCTSDFGLDWGDVSNTLFGQEQYEILTNGDESFSRMSRADDGLFFNKEGNHNTRVSGVFISEVYQSNLHVAKHWLIKNPHAKKELPSNHIRLSRIEIVDEYIESVEKESITDILGVED